MPQAEESFLPIPPDSLKFTFSHTDHLGNLNTLLYQGYSLECVGTADRRYRGQKRGEQPLIARV